MSKKYIIYTCLFWLVIIGASLSWNTSVEIKSHRETVHQGARAFFQQIVLTRSWNAGHGGVYVPVTEVTKPNPYLKDELRDLVTVSGMKLTKINPAYMTRQIGEIAHKKEGVKFHITSLKPIRPANMASEWETGILKKFEKGLDEYGEFLNQENSSVYKYMAPLSVEKSCLKCHADQGYRLGDIRGGISVTIPGEKNIYNVPHILSHLLIASAGILLIIFFGVKIENYQTSLLHAKIEAESANRAKSRFLTNLSHEIRTPMNAILGFSDILLKCGVDEKQQNYLSIIRTSGHSLLEIINDILDLSRMESGKMELEYSAVNLKTLMKEVRAIFSLQVIEKNIEFSTEIDERLPGDLLLDRVRIKQVIINLIGNAMKFTDEGHVKLSAGLIFRNGGNSSLDVIFSIEDTGMGISEDETDSIFEPFTQQEDQSQSLYGGTGLGLSISRRIVRAMNGDISVNSIKGKGSTFTVVIKNVQVASISGMDTDMEAADNYDNDIFNGVSILVVDDNFYNREIIKKQLDFKGLTVYDAENGKQAVEIAETSVPDLIIMDVNMPVMNGAEAIEILRKEQRLKDTVIIVLSASIHPENEKELMESCDLYLKKPVTRNLLIYYITSLLKKEGKIKIQKPADELTGDTADLNDENIFATDTLEISDAEELLIILEGSMLETWQSLNRGIMVKQGITFSTKVVELGIKYKTESLTRWGQELGRQLEALDFTGARKTISEYPDLINRIKDHTTDGRPHG